MKKLKLTKEQIEEARIAWNEVRIKYEAYPFTKTDWAKIKRLDSDIRIEAFGFQCGYANSKGWE